MDKNTRTSHLPAIAFALAALTAIVPSAALANGEPPREKVPYGDLDLTSAAGIETLDRRLDRAVRRVCGEAALNNLAAQRHIGECRDKTRQSIQDDRQFAIARATGEQNVRWAERTSRGAAQVSLAE